MEKVHLAFMKWTLSVNKYTSNAAIWGDTGRYPLGVELSALALGYLERLEKLDANDSTTLVRHALVEQRKLNLLWYSRLNATRNAAGTLHTTGGMASPSLVRDWIRKSFIQQWNTERLENKKLAFYNSIKTEFGYEKYLNLNLSHFKMKRLAQFRTSSHQYNVETGRHGILRRKNVLNRICTQCSTNEMETLEHLAALPNFEPIIEDEIHVLRTCVLYEDLRHNLSQLTKTCLFADLYRLFTEEDLIRETSKFLAKAHERRFPKKATMNDEEST